MIQSYTLMQIIHFYPWYFWGGFILFLIFGSFIFFMLEPARAHSYRYSYSLLFLQFLCRVGVVFATWCLAFEFLFLVDTDIASRARDQMLWEQILNERQELHFKERIWGGEISFGDTESVPDCPSALWSYKGQISSLAVWETRNCIRGELSRLRSGAYSRRQGVKELFENVMSYSYVSASEKGWITWLEKNIFSHHLVGEILDLRMFRALHDDIFSTLSTGEMIYIANEEKRNKIINEIEIEKDEFIENIVILLNKKSRAAGEVKSLPIGIDYQQPEPLPLNSETRMIRPLQTKEDKTFPIFVQP